MVFKRCGCLSRAERWTCNNCNIEIVNDFSYVGVFFNNRLSLHKMADSMTVKAKKVLYHLFNSLQQYTCLPYITFFKLFDSKIAPIMWYGSELWALKQVHCLEA